MEILSFKYNRIKRMRQKSDNFIPHTDAQFLHTAIFVFSC